MATSLELNLPAKKGDRNNAYYAMRSDRKVDAVRNDSTMQRDEAVTERNNE